MFLLLGQVTYTTVFMREVSYSFTLTPPTNANHLATEPSISDNGKHLPSDKQSNGANPIQPKGNFYCHNPVYELRAKLVKNILSGEFMELCQLSCFQRT